MRLSELYDGVPIDVCADRCDVCSMMKVLPVDITCDDIWQNFCDLMFDEFVDAVWEISKDKERRRGMRTF